MGYDRIYRCTVHDLCDEYITVQSMTYGVYILPEPLYNPWAMGIYISVQPMNHGVDILLYSP